MYSQQIMKQHSVPWFKSLSLSVAVWPNALGKYAPCLTYRSQRMCCIAGKINGFKLSLMFAGRQRYLPFHDFHNSDWEESTYVTTAPYGRIYKPFLKGGPDSTMWSCSHCGISKPASLRLWVKMRVGLERERRGQVVV